MCKLNPETCVRLFIKSLQKSITTNKLSKWQDISITYKNQSHCLYWQHKMETKVENKTTYNSIKNYKILKNILTKNHAKPLHKEI